MAKFFAEINNEHREFIDRQALFFVATAAEEGRINLSPKGLDAFRVLSPNQAAYLDVTGSGNETAAHLRADGRITIMFCSFDATPLILRLYGRASAVKPRDARWQTLLAQFPALPGARQIMLVDIESVQTSCGFSIPLMEFKAQRETLNEWANKKGPAGIAQYWQERNQASIDGLATGLLTED